MKIDLYTKTVLTVIACCLMYLCFARRAPTVHAAEPTPVVIVGQTDGMGNIRGGILSVGLAATRCVGGDPQTRTSCGWEYQSIPVSVTSQNHHSTNAK
jgi:hypothetical protein